MVNNLRSELDTVLEIVKSLYWTNAALINGNSDGQVYRWIQSNIWDIKDLGRRLNEE